MNTTIFANICFCVGVLIFCALIPVIMNMDKSPKQRKSFWITMAFCVAFSGIFYAGCVMGAYGQMRGEYKVTYKMDENMKVTDTIIHVR